MRPHCFRRVCVVSLAAALSAAAVAQSQQWQPLPGLNAIGYRIGFSLVPLGPDLLLFGGNAGVPGETEFLWDGLAWRSLTTPVPRRNGAAIAASDDGQLLVYGGLAGAGWALTDTWHYGPAGWAQETPAVVPVLDEPSLTFDTLGGTFVLVGREPGGLMQTFRFVNGDWVAINGQELPFGRAWLVTDTIRGEVLATVQGGPQAELFRLVGDDWQSLTLLGSPNGFLPCFDAERGRVVMTSVTGVATLRTREWDGDALVADVTSTWGSAPQLQAIAWHGARHEAVAAFASGVIELIRFAPAPVPMAAAYGDPCQDPTLSLALSAGDTPRPGVPHRLEVTGQTTGPVLVLSDIGLSHVAAGGGILPVPIPFGGLGCLLRVEPLVLSFLGTSLPATQLLQFANNPALLGVRYDAQALLVDGSGVIDTSNGLEVQLGWPLAEEALVESFDNDANRDPLASGDPWSGGMTATALLGGDGRHGSFVASDGAAIGVNTYEWSTDNQSIPATRTLDGQSATVTDGQFWFTDFVVPAGVTVRFVGSVPAVLHVRGEVRIDGRVESNGQDASSVIALVGPAAGQRISTFHARGFPSSIQVLGQLGTPGGCGAGRGGTGGKEGNNTGPEVVNGVFLNDGQPGEDVQVAAGHAYAAQAAGTGGRGSKQTPASGISQTLPSTQLIANIYLPYYSSGGSGGGYRTAGGVPVPCDPTSLTPIITEPAAAAGAAFGLLPYPSPAPAGYSSLQHFTVGGSGGGGGGSHGFGLFGFTVSTERWMAGHGGMGGGGAIALRAGGPVTIGAGAELQARGGDGANITGDDVSTFSTADINAGISSPGGGGSGGSFLVQSAADITVAGSIDTRGGQGSVVQLVSLLQMQIQTPGEAGDGADGFFRLESATGVAFTGTSVPAYDPVTQSGTLLDRDTNSGSRSKWLLPASSTLPVYVRYELLVDVDGNGVADALFSDDPDVGMLASGAGVPVQLRLQGARLDAATGQPLAGSIGPWRTTAAPGDSSINRDHARLVRFDLVTDRGQFPSAQVTELRIVWR